MEKKDRIASLEELKVALTKQRDISEVDYRTVQALALQKATDETTAALTQVKQKNEVLDKKLEKVDELISELK